MTTKQEEFDKLLEGFDKLLEGFVAAHDDYRATLKRAESLGTDEAYADAEDARQHRDAARGAVCAFVFPPAPTLRHPWEISEEDYLASVPDFASAPGLFTPENGWHVGHENGGGNFWRSCGDSPWPLFRNGGAVAFEASKSPYVFTDFVKHPLTVENLRMILDRAKGSDEYKHPLGLARR